MNETLTEVHRICIEKNLPFTTFRLPRQSNSTTYIQTSSQTVQWNSIHDLSVQKGFIMAPFDTQNGKQYIMVKPDIVIEGVVVGEKVMGQIRELPGNDPTTWENEDPVVIGQEDYLEQVREIKKNISRGYFQKAVLSRVRKVGGNYLPVITHIYNEACHRHPNAFVYLFKSEEHFWMGASPEPLLRLSDNNISTVSLAGTRPYSELNMELNNWTMKEALEQEYVTRYIHDKLREYQIRDYNITSPYVKKAGDLVHLRTDFSFNYDQVSERIWEFLDAMHPTPAVAGQPKDEAISYIKEIELHDREYYTGFLGPVRSNEHIDLFVNLRCMKISPGYLSLYVGGGITLESVPEDEWEETQLKAKSLLSIIDSFAKNKDDKNAVQSTHS